MRALISKTCLILGGMLITASLILFVYNVWDSRRAQEASQEILEKIEKLQEETEEKVAEESEKDPEKTIPLYRKYPDMAMPVYIIDGYAYIGTLRFPDINLELPVMDTWDYDRLRIAPCRYSGSVYQNNLVIAGHNYAAHFSPVKELPVGSEIIFTDAAGNQFDYEIAWTEILDPTQTEELEGDEENSWDMTLFTCTIGGATRYTVRCVLKKESFF